MASMSIYGVNEGESATLETEVSCSSYHLSDFTISTAEPERVFRRVNLVRM